MRAEHHARRYAYRKFLGVFVVAICFLPAAAFALDPTDTSTGNGALEAENGGFQNTADGYIALQANSTGASNTAVGAYALSVNNGNQNTGTGMGALASNTSGASNTAIGYYALEASVTGSNNVAIGSGALKVFTSGTGNIALGTNAGSQLKTANGNIEIGSAGAPSDNHAIRIGGTQTKTFIAGIKGVALSGATVVINAHGQLGVVASSARYKKNIQSLGDTSDKLAQLRPVTYEYKTAPGVTHFGLVAEEVDKVMPELVVRDAKNRPDSVQYQELIPLLLQQWKAQQTEIAQLRTQLAQQRSELAALRQALVTRHASLGGSTGVEIAGR